jgi:hypothetical protein
VRSYRARTLPVSWSLLQSPLLAMSQWKCQFEDEAGESGAPGILVPFGRDGEQFAGLTEFALGVLLGS